VVDAFGSDARGTTFRRTVALMLLGGFTACEQRTYNVATTTRQQEAEHAPTALAQATSAPDAPQRRVFKGRYMVSSLYYSVHRNPDQARYRLPVVEKYRVGPANILSYSAYFMNMPIHLNHNDSIDWSIGESEFELHQAVDTVADQLVPLGEEETAPAGAYVIVLRINNRDSARYVSDQRSRAWAVIDPAFQKMIHAFERATGRPLDPYKLPAGK
jgi:hypothetical protein